MQLTHLHLHALATSAVLGTVVAQYGTARRPNVVFILTDDQDAKLDSMDYMPAVRKHLTEHGTNFEKHYCTVAVCCPSRVSLLTGKHAHNTNVTNVIPPYGGYPKFIEEGHNAAWVPLWLEHAGVDSYYVGKLMNHHNITNYKEPYPSGFKAHDFLVDPFTYDYMNPAFQRNEELPVFHKDQLSTDLIHKKAIRFFEDAVGNPNTPFFLTIAPIAPHSDFVSTLDSGGDSGIGLEISPPIPAVRHKDLFPNATVPRGPSFNPDVPSGVDWIYDTPVLTPENITYNDHLYRQRLRSLQAVDELVDAVFQKLEDLEILDNTYIFYTSDNGYHIGQHRLPSGKGCGFEEDINVPMIVRGPGVPANKTVTFATNHVDFAPTWWNIFSIPLREEFDGVPIPLTEEKICAVEDSGVANEHVQIEFWMQQNPSEYYNEAPVNNTYKGVRIVGENYGWYYNVWCSGSHELYDMKRSIPDAQHARKYHNFNHRVHNSDYPTRQLDNSTYPLATLQSRLDALILVLKSCKGEVCSDPWNELLPGNNVKVLTQAMDSQYDSYFAQLPKVSYSICEGGYIIASEGPQWEIGLGMTDIHSLARRGRPLGNRP